MTDGLNEESLMSSDQDVLQRVKDFVRRVSTARLQRRHPTADLSDLPDDVDLQAYIRDLELRYEHNIDRQQSYFKDAEHPCRERFQAQDRDYNFDPVTGEIADANVQKSFRRLQYANQMHTCRTSCWKYCLSG